MGLFGRKKKEEHVLVAEKKEKIIFYPQNPLTDDLEELAQKLAKEPAGFLSLGFLADAEKCNNHELVLEALKESVIRRIIKLDIQDSNPEVLYYMVALRSDYINEHN